MIHSKQLFILIKRIICLQRNKKKTKFEAKNSFDRCLFFIVAFCVCLIVKQFSILLNDLLFLFEFAFIFQFQFSSLSSINRMKIDREPSHRSSQSKFNYCILKITVSSNVSCCFFFFFFDIFSYHVGWMIGANLRSGWNIEFRGRIRKR